MKQCTAEQKWTEFYSKSFHIAPDTITESSIIITNYLENYFFYNPPAGAPTGAADHVGDGSLTVWEPLRRKLGRCKQHEGLRTAGEGLSGEQDGVPVGGGQEPERTEDAQHCPQAVEPRG